MRLFKIDINAIEVFLINYMSKITPKKQKRQHNIPEMPFSQNKAPRHSK